jgi:hypothetical protein
MLDYQQYKAQIHRLEIFLFVYIKTYKMYKFKAELDIIGINPFVFVPNDILQEIFKQAGKNIGHIPIKGTINGKPYKQTLVKYLGEWRLYINTSMLKNSPKKIGETIEITVCFDPESREIEPPNDFLKALTDNEEAKIVFDNLPPSRKFEIVRYLARLKTEEILEKNIKRAINFLLGNERFIGRDKP